jgi:hypothetical protein
MTGITFDEDRLEYSGWVDVFKRFSDGSEEMVYSEHNVVTSGMGVTLGSLFASQGQYIDDFKIDRFQVGDGNGTEVDTRSSLDAPFITSEYGAGSPLSLISSNVWERGATTSQIFAKIAPQNILKTGNNKVTFLLVLDENTANGQDINEFGLFSSNPLGLSPQGSLLCAFKSIATISKSSAFSLIIKWTIQF